jgi:DNA-binding transcriptional LysR family regulator
MKQSTEFGKDFCTLNTNQVISLLPEMAIFVHVVESKNFSDTAKALGVSPSSVSRAVTKLENSLKQKLLERTTRKMRVTRKGEEIYLICCNIMKSAQLATKAAQSDSEDVCGALRVAAPKALAKQVLMPIILDFVEQHPKVDFQLKVSDQYLDPISDDIDVLIHITDQPVESLVGRTLAKCKLLLCAAPSYIAENGMPSHPQDLAQHNCLCLGEELKDRYWKLTKDHVCSVAVKGSFHVNHSEIRMEAVLRGLGISVFPEFSIRPYVESGEVIVLMKDWHVSGNYQGEVIAQYPQSRYIPNQLKEFMDHLTRRLS